MVGDIDKGGHPYLSLLILALHLLGNEPDLMDKGSVIAASMAMTIRGSTRKASVRALINVGGWGTPSAILQSRCPLFPLNWHGHFHGHESTWITEGFAMSAAYLPTISTGEVVH